MIILYVVNNKNTLYIVYIDLNRMLSLYMYELYIIFYVLSDTKISLILILIRMFQ